MNQQANSGRLLSLDILRGITIAGMIMVNNPGSWGSMYAPLQHASWHGLTPTDLVFPFFMFIMGISTYISLRKFNFEFSKPTLYKILKRTIIIFLIGVGISWLSLSFRTFHGLAAEELGFFERFGRAISNFEKLRILGVMQRLAITYGATSLIAIFVKHKYIPYIIGTTLVAYFFILVFGNGFEFSENNVLSVVDRAVLGVNHMYRDAGVSLEPEGLLSTIPAICHVLIGFYCAKALMSTKDNQERIVNLFIIGAAMTFVGFLLSYGCPINKKIWSPTYVLVTCGLAATLLALLIWIIDIKGYKRWSVFFESFGVNPLFIYVMAGVLSILLNNIRFMFDGSIITAKNFAHQIVIQRNFDAFGAFLDSLFGMSNNFFAGLFGHEFSSLLYALIFVSINWVVGNILYKKKIYIKI